MWVYSSAAAMRTPLPAVHAFLAPLSAAVAAAGAPRTSGAPRRATGAARILLVAALCAACEKDEAPPPLPAQQETAEAPQALTLEPEDAGLPTEPAKKATRSTRSRPKTSVSKCCKALKQNAASAPEPTKGYMTYAAQICEAAAAAGQSQASIVRAIEGALKGAGLPPGCR